MSVGNWTPDISGSSGKEGPEPSDIGHMLEIGSSEPLEGITEKLDDEQQQRYSQWIGLTYEVWETLLAEYDNAQLWLLIRFFTAAEMQLPGWNFGNDSPVIKINKILKARKAPLGKEQLLWIRNNSTNRYIPNGAISL